MRLFLIRHGETVTSGRTYAGRSDVPLTAHGRRQARSVAQRLADCPVSLVLSSPLTRAMDTARLLAEAHGLDPEPEPALMELDFGTHEGRNKAALGLTLRKTYAFAPMPGGECLHDVWVRVGGVLERLRTRPDAPEMTCAVVGHFWVNRLFRGRAAGLTFDAACRSRDYRPETGSCVEMTLPAMAPSHSASDT